MKTFLLTVMVAAAAVGTVSCVVSSVVQGSGKEAHGEFDIASGYTSLSVSSGITVELVLSDSGTGTITADEKVLQFVSIVENGDRVTVSYDPSISLNSPVKTVVRLPLGSALSEIDASSGALVASGRRITARTMAIDCSSAARVELDIDATELRLDLSSAASFGGNVAASNFEADLSSAATCEVEGSAERSRVDASSAANFRGLGLVSRRAAVDASSGGGVEITASEEITAGASSGASVRYGGNPTIVRQNALSGGSVRSVK